LLRSDKSDGAPTRLEILFSPVAYMGVGCGVYTGMVLYRLSHTELLDMLGEGIEIDLAGMQIFGIGDELIRGVVVAGGYLQDEGAGDFWEPSRILKFEY
ncbi:hypothetical protein, partial [Kitasatospora sp. NPDC085464]|uniref:hypothetical protein n=1 Tax=Kitasatospora sp. NPDC085464 TaxID=3364063 RepID=UPI0037C9ADFA